jgi:phage terminase Nu1 subunit (DNA packaging protein)
MATIGECAEWLRMSTRRFQQLVDEGIVTRQVTNGYEVKMVVGEYIEHLREVASGRSAGTLDKAAEDIRKVRAQADKAEMEVAEMRGDLVPSDVIGTAWELFSTVIKNRITSLPSKAAPRVGAANVAQAEREIRACVNEVLSEIETINVEEQTAKAKTKAAA